MTTIISKAEYKRRDRIYQKKKYKSEEAKKNYQEQLKAQGKLTKKQEISQRRAKIKDLLAQGLTQKEIYTLMKISKRTCINDVQFLRRQGLI